MEQAIAELRYRPSRAAATLAGSRTRTIGVLIEDYRNLWFVELLTGLQLELAPLGYRVAVEELSLNASVDASPVDGLLALRVEGIVIATEPTEEMASVTNIPVVVAGSRELVLPGADVVANDDHLGGRLATEHLLELGHRRIGHVTGAGRAARLRTEAYTETLRAADLPIRIFGGHGFGTTEIDGYQLADRLLQDHPDTTAIFAANDLMALGVAAAAQERGRRVPQDLSLIGYDNSPLAHAQLLRLTTVDDRSRQVGIAAARHLLSRLDESTAEPTVSLIAPELVVRSSTAPTDLAVRRYPATVGIRRPPPPEARRSPTVIGPRARDERCEKVQAGNDQRRRRGMSDNVYRVTEIVGTSTEGVDAAIRTGIGRASETLRGLDWFEVTQIRGHLVDGQIAHYQVGLKLGFRLEGPRVGPAEDQAAQSGSRPKAISRSACGSPLGDDVGRSATIPAERYMGSRSRYHAATSATTSGSSARSWPVAAARSQPWIR